MGTDSETDGGATSESRKRESKLNFYTGITKDILEEAKNRMRLRCVCECLFPSATLRLDWTNQAFNEASAKLLHGKSKSKVKYR